METERYERIMSPINFAIAGWVGAIAVEAATNGRIGQAVAFGLMALGNGGAGIEKYKKVISNKNTEMNMLTDEVNDDV